MTLSNKHTSNIKAVLFDLDGTLVDTAKDFVRIIHELAAENNWKPPSNEVIREQVSAGSKAMVSLFDNLDARTDAEKLDTLRQQFLDRYEANICVNSDLFTGLATILNYLERKNILWGVVTNKPRHLSEKLLDEIKLSDRCASLVCPEDVTRSKPDPEPMYLAMSELGLRKEESNSVIYIGDHIRDIQAGNAAGNITIIAGYGYISQIEKQKLSDWQANYCVKTSEELIELLQTLIED